jgi:sporulation protein YlmC with PRC-barrel domain
MKKFSKTAIAVFIIIGTLSSAWPVAAQFAGGTTTVETSVTESTKLAMGWSVKRTLLSKSIYNEAGKKVGRVEDLIISPDRNVSYVIIGAGGFVGIGRHDVAVPMTQIQEQAGKLILPGATKDSIKDMPEFAYATDTTKRAAFLAAADKDIAKGKVAVGSLEKKASVATAEAKAKIDIEITALQADLKSAEAKLSAMKQSGTTRWREFENDVSAAMARLRKSTEKATV